MIKFNYDPSGLQALRKKYEVASRVWTAYHLQLVVDIANEIIANTQMRTPVDSGRLRQNWRLGEVLQDDNTVIVEIINNTEYASHVEYGHRQNVGQYVPAIGKRLVQPKVEGKFMFTKSMNEADRDMEARVKKEFANFWNNLRV